MPILNDTDMENHLIGGSTFGFSAKRLEDLGASEYTLGVILIDVSGSVHPFKLDIENTIKEIIRSCRHSPRADNMMLRLVFFDNEITEYHGFKPLTECNEDDYTGCITIGGMTALYDAAYTGVKSATDYGANLTGADYDVNAAVFLVTDGMDNRSRVTRKMVKEALNEAVSTESLESIVAVLIGLGNNLDQYLDEFKNETGFTQYVQVGQANEKTLARLGKFVSQSFSSQSQALGTGGPSQSLSF